MIALTLNPDRWLAYVATQRKALDAMMAKTACRVISWAVSRRDVQHAIVHAISCRTPIGVALNDQINAVVDGGHPGGLDRAIEDGIEDYMRSNNMSIDADEVKDLDAAVSEIVSNDRDLVKHIASAVMEEIAEKLSR